MKERDARLIEAKVEAAFDRYNRAVLSGLEPTPGRFVDSLEAEGLSLSISSATAVQKAPEQTRSAGWQVRGASTFFGRRAGDLVERRIRSRS